MKAKFNRSPAYKLPASREKNGLLAQLPQKNKTQ
jgi:hypothetical protein